MRKKGARRLDLENITADVNDATCYNKDFGMFDRVICDVPCSGIGVIRRKPEIKYKSEAECSKLPEIQKEILSVASQYVKTGGRLVYSTCTLLKEENDSVVNAFLDNNKDFKLVSVLNKADNATVTFMPPEDCGDGFFVAVMERA